MYPQELCGLIAHVYEHNWPLKFLFLVQFFFASFSLICLIILGLLINIWRCFSVHIRLLILSFLVALVFADIGVLLSSVYQLQVILFRANDTRCYWFSYTYNDCHVIRLLFNISVVGIYTSSTIFAVESLISWSFKLKNSTSKYLSLFLISVQWLCSTIIGFDVNLFFDKTAQSKLHQPHCSTLIPTPTQFNGIFFILLSLHIFALIIYTVSYIYFSKKKVMKRLETVNKKLYEQFIFNDVTFPLICMIVSLYVANVVLDGHFLSIIISMVKSDTHENEFNYSTKALWYECQTAIVPLTSILIFGFLIKRIWPENPIQHQQETLGRTIDGGFDEKSDALSFHSLEGTLKCNKAMQERCQEICSKLPQTSSPSISTFLPSNSSSSPKLYDMEEGRITRSKNQSNSSKD
ncbi:unnamed protein product [Bursaphelenchus xylophilus]|uniref:(pine wood nematode) hypothetical protein n=1 Tax=Bursaphelenchus xylophilus TaxID=6326 RepID=A0A1I7SF86_BURXY|nr:unnamed protein product [Bursaphelenchus xylophilus]CAG9130471.1 unnamed protein product [Bursaphelenchus xylophilus]